LARRSLGRWQHIAILVPLGAAVGALGGLVWDDFLAGIAVGAGFGAVFGLLLALRNVKP